MTPELVEKLSSGIAEGLPDKFACQLVGITEETYHAWRHEYVEFSDVINMATASRMLKRIKSIDKGTPGYQGTCWMLERRWPQYFSRPELQLSLNVHHTGEIEHTVQMVAESEMQKMLEMTREIESEVIE